MMMMMIMMMMMMIIIILSQQSRESYEGAGARGGADKSSDSLPRVRRLLDRKSGDGRTHIEPGIEV